MEDRNNRSDPPMVDSCKRVEMSVCRTPTSECNNERRACLHDKQPMIVNEKTYIEPPDGGWGWVIVVAVWINNVLVLGMLKSFGVLFPAFRSYFQENASAISWINSISLSMRAIAAPLAAALSNRFGEQRVVAAGGVLVFLGLIISIFATSPYHLYASLGCVSGFGFALASLPALTMIGRYFKERRSLANGLSRSGGAATFFLAPLLQFLVDVYGWQGCLLIVAGMELHLIACALLFRPVRLKEELEFKPDQTLQKHRLSIKPPTDDGDFDDLKPGIVARRAISDVHEAKNLPKDILDKVKENGVTESLLVEHFPAIEPVYQPKKRRTLDFSLLKNPQWAVITVNLVLTQFGYSITLVHTVARAKLKGIGEYESALLLSMIGLSEVVAQLSSGAFADKIRLRRIHLHKIYIAIMAMATVCSLFANSFLTMSIYCVVFGCGSGSWQDTRIGKKKWPTWGRTHVRDTVYSFITIKGVSKQLQHSSSYSGYARCAETAECLWILLIFQRSLRPVDWATSCGRAFRRNAVLQQQFPCGYSVLHRGLCCFVVGNTRSSLRQKEREREKSDEKREW